MTFLLLTHYAYIYDSDPSNHPTCFHPSLLFTHHSSPLLTTPSPLSHPLPRWHADTSSCGIPDRTALATDGYTPSGPRSWRARVRWSCSSYTRARRGGRRRRRVSSGARREMRRSMGRRRLHRQHQRRQQRRGRHRQWGQSRRRQKEHRQGDDADNNARKTQPPGCWASQPSRGI